ncbi:glycoside hydrolase family 92 protein [Athelia psychrophila]|uniref:Glycoside hydrolase family 92 protein n=1 Tax=Athelia psychrophila TaxID=1759441 RepID=A0A166KLD3_9AGAM|nr:glycoside hydrolase family 92 protein [Fibularhizoctonia sp. CBS 109695]
MSVPERLSHSEWQARTTQRELSHIDLRLPQAKITADFTGYAPAGYITDETQYCYGLSPPHDRGRIRAHSTAPAGSRYTLCTELLCGAAKF